MKKNDSTSMTQVHKNTSIKKKEIKKKEGKKKQRKIEGKERTRIAW